MKDYLEMMLDVDMKINVRRRNENKKLWLYFWMEKRRKRQKERQRNGKRQRLKKNDLKKIDVQDPWHWSKNTRSLRRLWEIVQIGWSTRSHLNKKMKKAKKEWKMERCETTQLCEVDVKWHVVILYECCWWNVYCWTQNTNIKRKRKKILEKVKIS